jgi:hypothetical protein
MPNEINHYIDEIVAANGNEAELRSAVVKLKLEIKECIAEPFALAADIGLPTGWRATRSKNKEYKICGPDGYIFRSVNKAKAFVEMQSGNQSGKLTDEEAQAFSLNLPSGWRAFKKMIGTKITWTCINPEGIQFSSLKSALDSLKPPADAYPATVDAAPIETNDTSLAQRLEMAVNLLSQTMAMQSQAMAMLNGLTRELADGEDAKPAAKMATNQQAGPSSTSAVAVTAKKPQGRKRTLSDSDDDYTPDF